MRRPDYDRRVVVTGLGTVSPIGNDVATVWSNLVAGCSGLAPITRFDASSYESNAAGEVKGFDAKDWMDFKAARRTGLNVQFGVAAARQALADSGIEVTTDNRDELGIIFASGAGEPKLMMDNKDIWDRKGPRLVSPFFIANMLVDTASGQIAIETGIRGHVASMIDGGIDAELRIVASTYAGGPAHEIAEVAKDVDAGLIVAGTRGYGVVTGLLVGSVAHRLPYVSPCPVLVVPLPGSSDGNAAA